jgi:PAS domain S-box-containing protein
MLSDTRFAPDDDGPPLSEEEAVAILEELGKFAPNEQQVDQPPSEPVPVPRFAVEPLALTPDAVGVIIDAIPDALVITNEAGQIVFVNPECERLFGYARDELIGWTVEVLVPERFHARHVLDRTRYAAEPRTRPMRGDLVGRRRDGAEVPVEIGLSPLVIGGARYVVASVRDVTERRQAEAKQKKLKARFQTLVEQIPAVSFMAPLDGTITELYVSPQIEQLLGFTAEEWLSNPILWYTQLHPDDQERWQEAFARTLNAGEHFKSDYRFIARDGRIVWVHGEAQVVCDDDGRPMFLQGVAFDKTAAKETEEQLAQRVAERTAEAEARAAELARANEELRCAREELEDYARELERWNRELKRFAGTVSHDLKKPLATIVADIQTLRAKDPDRFEPGDRDASLAPILTTAANMDKQIDGFLEFSTVQTAEVEFVPTSCREAFDAARVLLRGEINRWDAKFVGDERLPVVRASAPQLVRLFQTLIENSLKFRVAERVPEITVTANRDGGNWVIEVRDNGIGIEELTMQFSTPVKPILEKIFDLGSVSRQHAGKKFGGKYPGHGIGLATCKDIVERHGGWIKAKSDGHDKGTTIFFALPAAD